LVLGIFVATKKVFRKALLIGNATFDEIKINHVFVSFLVAVRNQNRLNSSKATNHTKEE